MTNRQTQPWKYTANNLRLNFYCSFEKFHNSCFNLIKKLWLDFCTFCRICKFHQRHRKMLIELSDRRSGRVECRCKVHVFPFGCRSDRSRRRLRRRKYPRSWFQRGSHWWWRMEQCCRIWSQMMSLRWLKSCCLVCEFCSMIGLRRVPVQRAGSPGLWRIYWENQRVQKYEKILQKSFKITWTSSC